MCEAHCDINSSEQICLFEFSRSIWGPKTWQDLKPAAENHCVKTCQLRVTTYSYRGGESGPHGVIYKSGCKFYLMRSWRRGRRTLLKEKPQRCARLSEKCFWRAFYGASNKLNKKLERGQQEQQGMGIFLMLHRATNKACYRRIPVRLVWSWSGLNVSGCVFSTFRKCHKKYQDMIFTGSISSVCFKRNKRKQKWTWIRPSFTAMGISIQGHYLMYCKHLHTHSQTHVWLHVWGPHGNSASPCKGGLLHGPLRAQCSVANTHPPFFPSNWGNNIHVILKKTKGNRVG